jgi:hypothetical protein
VPVPPIPIDGHPEPRFLARFIGHDGTSYSRFAVPFYHRNSPPRQGDNPRSINS